MGSAERGGNTYPGGADDAENLREDQIRQAEFFTKNVADRNACAVCGPDGGRQDLDRIAQKTRGGSIEAGADGYGFRSARSRLMANFTRPATSWMSSLRMRLER